MHLTLLQFPEISLLRRDGHKLRGYFANLFGKESDLFHNHDGAGRSLYRYSRIQYKVVDRMPVLVGIDDGGRLLAERFLNIKELDIDGKTIPLRHKNIISEEVAVGLGENLVAYEFATPWFPLNQANYRAYEKLDAVRQKKQLKSILIGNILSVLSVGNYFAEEKIMVHLNLQPPRFSKFKNQKILVFQGSFVTNAILPDYIGLGKSVARGYGTIRKVD